MGRPKKATPAYTLHKPSGQARVRIAGQDYYLGRYDTPESWQAYYALLGKLASGDAKPSKPSPPNRGFRVDELVAHYLEQAARDFGASWQNAKWRILGATRPLVSLFGDEPANTFDALQLQRVIDQIITNGSQRPENVKQGRHVALTAPTVNHFLDELKRMFRWAASQKIVPAAVYHELATVSGVTAGRGRQGNRVKKPGKIKPVTQEQIDAIMPHIGPEIAAMIQVQRLAGMRPDEVTIMRPCDIEPDTITIEGKKHEVWIYRPTKHKSDWREGQEEKEITIGPRAQDILTTWLADKSATEYLFSPRAAVARYLAKQTSDLPRERARAANLKKLQQVRPAREHYDHYTYCRAVRRGCNRAGIPPWSPNQLRHTAATEVQARYGAEAVRLVLNHQHIKTGQIYAERDKAKYAEIMVAMG